MKSNFITKCANYWRRKKRERWLTLLRKRNANHDFCLITNDCVGGAIYHDLGDRFQSSAANLWILNEHFLEFAQNLKYYLSCDINENPDGANPYPVGTIIPKDNGYIPV